MAKAILMGIDMLVAFMVMGTVVMLTLLNLVNMQGSFEGVFGDMERALQVNVYLQKIGQVAGSTGANAPLYGLGNYTLAKLNATQAPNPSPYNGRILVLNGTPYYLVER